MLITCDQSRNKATQIILVWGAHLQVLMRKHLPSPHSPVGYASPTGRGWASGLSCTRLESHIHAGRHCRQGPASPAPRSERRGSVLALGEGCRGSGYPGDKLTHPQKTGVAPDSVRNMGRQRAIRPQLLPQTLPPSLSSNSVQSMSTSGGMIVQRLVWTLPVWSWAHSLTSPSLFPHP